MLRKTDSGYIHLRDVPLDPVHIGSLCDLGLLHRAEREDEDSVVEAVQQAVARYTYEKLAELAEDRPVKLKPERDIIRALIRNGWLDINADATEIAGAIERLVVFALFKRLNAADAEREATISALLAKQAAEDRSSTLVTGAAARTLRDQKAYLAEIAAAAE
jgi:hypothetical protein